MQFFVSVCVIIILTTLADLASPGESSVVHATGNASSAVDTAATVQKVNPHAHVALYGYGAQPQDWSKARVVFVDKLSDSPGQSQPGELRYAVNVETGPRIVLFKVAGTIKLKLPLFIQERDADLWVAGQTAPGNGITLRGDHGDDVSDLIRLVDTSNVLLQFLRLRLGKGTPGRGDNISIIGSQNVLIDHVSMSWSNDENVGMWTSFERKLRNITVQNSLLAEPLAPHATNMLISSERDLADKKNAFTRFDNINNVSIHRNVFTRATHRNPMVIAANTRVANNLVFDWLYSSLGTVGSAEVDFINNILIQGHHALEKEHRIYTHQSFVFDPDDQPKDRFSEADKKNNFLPNGSVYLNGNMLDKYVSSQPNGSFDEWQTYAEWVGLSTRPFKCDGSDWRCLTNNRRTKTLGDRSDQPYPVEPAVEQLKANLLAEAGASMALDCAGKWRAARDAIDARQIMEIRQRVKRDYVLEPADVGGYIDNEARNFSCTDADNDYLPDDYEYRWVAGTYALSAFDDPDADGLVTIQEYLLGTNPVE